MMTSIALLVFFSYGHIRLLIRTVSVIGISLGRHRYLLPLAALTTGFGYWFIGNKVKDASRLTNRFNLMAVVLVIFPIINLSRSLAADFGLTKPQTKSQAPFVTSSNQPHEATPDIYYIILDGYAREDVLRDIYSFDNGEFIHELEKIGFFVASKSYSNYNKTVLSLASSLNLNYVQDYLDDETEKPTWGMIISLLNHNEVNEFLKNYDYEFVTFETGYKHTELENSDRYITFQGKRGYRFAGWQISLNEVEASLIETSLGSFFRDGAIKARLLVEINEPFEAHRSRVRGVFNKLEEIGSWEGNYFVFAHIVSPHPPFVFDSEGSPITPDYPYTLLDANELMTYLSRPEYIRGYREQLVYVNEMILQTVGAILDSSREPPIIILQADHGPGAYTDFRSMERTDLIERYAILNAYYFQGHTSDLLDPAVSPVNSFRIILNEFFNQDLPLLQDIRYFAEGGVSDLLPVPSFDLLP